MGHKTQNTFSNGLPLTAVLLLPLCSWYKTSVIPCIGKFLWAVIFSIYSIFAGGCLGNSLKQNLGCVLEKSIFGVELPRPLTEDALLGSLHIHLVVSVLQHIFSLCQLVHVNSLRIGI